MISNSITPPNKVPANNYSAIINANLPVSKSFVDNNENKNNDKVNISERLIEEVSEAKVISEDKKSEIIKVVASTNQVKIAEILNTFSVDDLAKLRFDFKTTHGNHYTNINLFFLACRSGCIKLVQALINNKHVDINELFLTSNGDITALAIASGLNIEITKILLEQGADITKKNSQGETVEIYSLAVFSATQGMDACYEIQTLFHEHRKKHGLPLGEISNRTCCNTNNNNGSYLEIIFFNENKDFVILSYDIDKDIIKNITHKSTHALIQKILDKIKSYVIPSDKCVGEEIIAYLNKAAAANNVHITDSKNFKNANLIDILCGNLSLLCGNSLDNIDINYVKSKIISVLYNLFIKDLLLKEYNIIVDGLKQDQVYSLEEFGNLDDLSKLSAEQQETVINIIAFFICTRSQQIPVLIRPLVLEMLAIVQ